MQLASVYRPPGFLLLAVGDDGERLGCVGARTLDGGAPVEAAGSAGSGRVVADRTGTEPAGADRTGPDRTIELRRLFVRPQARGTGLGRRLTERVVAAATEAGARRVVLNTLPEMVEAIELYRSLGFRQIAPYVEEPPDRVRYFAVDLPPG